MEERGRVSSYRLKLDITSTDCDELCILNENPARIYFKRRRHTSFCSVLRFYLLNPSKTKVSLNYTYRFTSHLAGTTIRLGYKNLSVSVG
jgi:hypothetical protein